MTGRPGCTTTWAENVDHKKIFMRIIDNISTNRSLEMTAQKKGRI